MTHIPDGAPFAPPYGPEEDGLIAIGWLDPDTPFPRGGVPQALIEELRRRCEHGVNLTRGFHGCAFCTDASIPIMVQTSLGEYAVGHAEIRVEGTDGERYAAPDMIIHYVEAHEYRPPDAFIDAALKSRG